MPRPVLARALLVTVLALGVPRLALAAGPSEAALSLFNDGRDLMRQGRFAEACPKLAESARLDPKVGTFGKLGECEEKLGHLVSALAHWRRAVDLARQINDPRAKDAEAERARIDAIVPKIEIVPPAQPGLVVRLDGNDLDAAALGKPLPVDPGRHLVDAGAPRRKPWSGPAEVKADGATLRLVIPPLEPAAAAAATETPAARADPGATLRVVGIATAAAGVVALGVGAYYGLHARGLQDDAAADCPSDRCTSAAAWSRLWDARVAADTSTIFFVAGGALLGSGAAMWMLAPSANGAGGGVAVRGRW